MRAFVVGVFTIVLASAAFADEKPVQLKQGTGLAAVEGHCGACHSLDYIEMNSPFLTGAAWETEVNKMVKAFGAPIESADVKTIAEYLKRNYSVDADVATGSGAAR